MNIFATIENAITYEKVTFYTVRLEGQQYTEFEKFILKHQDNDTVHNEYHDLLSLIQRLGERIGAKERYFSRHEKKAQALPPEWKSLPLGERKLHVKYQHNLRLYCMRITDEIVFLFDGGVKSPGAITAQDCKNVRQFFKLANQFAAAIEKSIIEKDIIPKGVYLEFDDDFELEI